jgi:HD-GYP domain-containing protein (c-di-GMP phosphodiesterase class II)
MAINYKRELENAAKNMILVHEPDTLIKMIVHRIVQKVGVNYAAILLHDRDNGVYRLTTSRLPARVKVPAGFMRMKESSPLIRFFRTHKDKELLNTGMLVYKNGQSACLKELPGSSKKILSGVLLAMQSFNIDVCIPGYFGADLIGILLLSRKRNGKKFNRHELDFFMAITSDVVMAIRNAQLFNELEIELQKKQKLFINTTIALAAAIDAKDHYTHGHTARVTDLSLSIARNLLKTSRNKLPEDFLDHLHIAALLHDIGKIGIPESILNKDGPLSDEENKMIKAHPDIGATILNPIKELEEAIQGVKYHHENYDGTGYPEGLKGNNIPLIASIISVADAFDAMTTDRPYRNCLTKHEAINEIKRVSKRQLNPRVVNALVRIYKEGVL